MQQMQVLELGRPMSLFIILGTSRQLQHWINLLSFSNIQGDKNASNSRLLHENGKRPSSQRLPCRLLSQVSFCT